MFTFASLVFLQAIDIFLLIFNLFPLFAERGRRNLEEIIHNENHWPQLLHKSGVECQIDRFACFAAYSLFIFSERKCISRSWRKLMNYKPEKRIPWLFTDFDNIKDFPWLCKKFPDFSLTLEKFSFFPDSGNPFVRIPPLRRTRAAKLRQPGFWEKCLNVFLTGCRLAGSFMCALFVLYIAMFSYSKTERPKGAPWRIIIKQIT